MASIFWWFDPVGSASLEVRSGETGSVTVRLGDAPTTARTRDPAWAPAGGTTGPALCTTRRSEPSG
jgi:hypothetical protein